MLPCEVPQEIKSEVAICCPGDSCGIVGNISYPNIFWGVAASAPILKIWLLRNKNTPAKIPIKELIIPKIVGIVAFFIIM